MTVQKIVREDSFEKYISVKGKQFSIEELQSDLSFLMEQLNTFHPALYAYTPKDTFDLLMDELNASIASGMTLGSFYPITATLTDAVKCSHTGVRLPDAYIRDAEQVKKYFPVRLYFTGGKAYFISGMDDVGPPMVPGDEVVRINGDPVEDIIGLTGRFVPSEGCNNTTKMNGLNRDFSALYTHQYDGNVFSVTFRSSGVERTIELLGKDYDTYRQFYGLSGSSREYEIEYIGHGQTAMLTLRTFGIRDMDAYFQFLDSVFVDLKGKTVSNLILDLRDNAGGHPIFAAQLFSYLTDSDFIYFKRNKMATDLEPLYNTMQPNPKNYKGSLFVLVNGGCLSTTGHLISLLKYHTEAVFVGEEPGSTYRCNDFSLQTTLPSTGIEVNIPQTTFEMAVGGFNLCDPFPPDLRINITVEDVLAGRDAYMETILERIREDRE